MTPNIITTIYVSRTPLQSCTAFWNYISKTGKTRKNVGYKCMYALQNVLHYKHKRQKHVSKKPSISLEETTYLPTLYTVVHGYKHGVTCCLHSELKSAAQAWHTHTHTHTHTHWPCLCIWEQGSSINTYCNLLLHSWCAYAWHVQYPHIIIIFNGLRTCVL